MLAGCFVSVWKQAIDRKHAQLMRLSGTGGVCAALLGDIMQKRRQRYPDLERSQCER